MSNETINANNEHAMSRNEVWPILPISLIAEGYSLSVDDRGSRYNIWCPWDCSQGSSTN